MSYENNRCPCTRTKPPQTMLCDDCNAALAPRHEMATFRDESRSSDQRRWAAVSLLALARRRNPQTRLGCRPAA
jgi:hypothetical protein